MPLNRLPTNNNLVIYELRLATTTDVYVQEIPESVKATVGAINKELRLRPKLVETAEAS